LEPLVQFINGVSRVKIKISRPTTGIQTENVGVASTRGERRRAGAHSATRERVLKKWVAVDCGQAGGGQAGRKKERVKLTNQNEVLL
jgi:hypothetical protein